MKSLLYSRRLGLAGLLLLSTSCVHRAHWYVDRGNALLREKKYAEAALNFRKAIQQASDSGEAFYGLGQAELKNYHNAEAYEALNRAVALLPAQDAPKVALADLALSGYLTDPKHPQSLYEQAVKLSDSLLARDPASFDGLRLKGSIALCDGHPADAIGYFERAHAVQPMQPDAVLGLMQALFRANRVAEGEALAWQFLGQTKNFFPLYDALRLHYLEARRPDLAEKVLVSAMTANPDETRPVLQLADFYAAGGRRADAEKTLERLLTNSRLAPDAYLSAGDFYSARGDAAQAIRYFEEGAKKDPGQAAAYQNRIRKLKVALLSDSGRPQDLEQAAGELEALLRESSNEAGLHLALGRVCLRRQQYDRARAAFQQAAHLRPQEAGAWMGLAETALEQQNFPDLLRFSEGVLGLQPDLPRARLLHAIGLTRADRVEEARVELRKLTEDHPRYTDAYLQLGLVAVEQKHYAEAEAIFRRVPSGGGDRRAAMALALAYENQHQPERALQLLEAEVHKADSPELRQRMAEIAWRNGRRNQAVEQYRELIARNPGSVALRLRLAEFYLSGGQMDGAFAELEKARQLAPRDPRPVKLLGYAWNNTGRLPEALRAYQHALELDPEDAHAMNNVAYLLAETGGNLDQAIGYARRAMQKLPDQPEFADTLGWLYLKKNLPDSAIQIFARLVQKHPGEPSFHYHMAVVLAQKGDKVRARAELEAAKNAHPPADIQQKISALLAQLG